MLFWICWSCSLANEARHPFFLVSSLSARSLSLSPSLSISLCVANLEQMRRLLAYEEPDFVVFGGDQISDYWGGAPYPKPLSWVTQKWSLALSPMFENGRRTPFATIMGNHDYGVEGTADTLLTFDAGHPGSLTRPSNDTSYVLELVDSVSSEAVMRFYMFNSGPVGMYQRHVDWYRSTSAGLKGNQKGKPAPALAFIHIPLVEFMYAYNAGTYRGHMGDRDGVCCQKTDHSLFQSFVEFDEVKVVSSGHDHGNNFVGQWQGIQLAYGLKTGDGGYDIESKRGARVFLISTGTNGSPRDVKGSLLYSQSNPIGNPGGRNKTLTVHSWLRFENGDIDFQDNPLLEPPRYQLEGCCIAPPKEIPWPLIIMTTITSLLVVAALALLVRAYVSYRRTISSARSASPRSIASSQELSINTTEMQELISTREADAENLHHED